MTPAPSDPHPSWGRGRDDRFPSALTGWAQSTDDVGALDAVLDLVAERIDAAAVARGMAEHVALQVPAIAAAVDQRPLMHDLEACCQANISAITEVLRRGGTIVGSVSVPAEARSFTLDLMHRRVPKEALLRGYRVGHGYLWNVLVGHLAEEPLANLAIADSIAGVLFAYIDGASEAHVEIYEAERRAWVLSAAAVRFQTVTDILDGATVPLDEATRRLGYDLRNVHVAAVFRAETSGPGGPAQDVLTDEADAALQATGQPAHLIVVATPYELWMWSTKDEQGAEDLVAHLEALTLPHGVQIAIGRPRRGVDGFRISHDEALQAARFCRPDIRRPSSYRRVELLSLLTADHPRCRRFVQAELGPLACSDEASGHLRDTALAFLDAGGSNAAAADALFLHKNTVYSRVRRAKAVLGREIEPGNRELHAALALAHAVPEIVLMPDDTGED